MITGKELFESYSDHSEDQKLFSTGNEELDGILEEVYYSGLEDGYDYAQKEFGAKSKALAIFAPGSYQAKEAAKYGYDNEEDYKKARGKYALLGLFAPGTSTYVKKKVEKMAEEGASEEEIREFLEGKGKYKKNKNVRIATGIAEAATGSGGGLGHIAATGVGLVDKISGDRKKFKEKDYSEKEEDRKNRKEARKGRRLENSHRGLGRSLFFGGLGGAIGAGSTKSDAEEEWKEGLSEEEIIKNAGKRGATRGAAISGAMGLAGAGMGAKAIKELVEKSGKGSKASKAAALGYAIGATASAAGSGALGGYLGAKKNARTRVQKSRKSDD